LEYYLFSTQLPITLDFSRKVEKILSELAPNSVIKITINFICKVIARPYRFPSRLKTGEGIAMLFLVFKRFLHDCWVVSLEMDYFVS
jgi:hypothetical protein